MCILLKLIVSDIIEILSVKIIARYPYAHILQKREKLPYCSKFSCVSFGRRSTQNLVGARYLTIPISIHVLKLG